MCFRNTSTTRSPTSQRTAYSYIPVLSALIYGQLLFLEYSLPLLPYNILKKHWLTRGSYGGNQVARFEKIRTKDLLLSGFYAMGQCIELRVWDVHFQEGGQGYYTRWSGSSRSEGRSAASTASNTCGKYFVIDSLGPVDLHIIIHSAFCSLIN